jgi:hypothetical protein
MSFHPPNSGALRRVLQGFAWLLMAGWAVQLRAADPPAPREYQIKAAIIYNFAKFVQWPTNTFALPDSPIILGVLGDDAVGRDLDAIEGKLIGAHPLRVRHLRYSSGLPECHILFVLPSQGMELPAIVETVQARSVLTICNGSKNFARAGAIINLTKTPDDKIRFEINVDAAKRAGLKIQSPLLNLAKIVRDPTLSR